MLYKWTHDVNIPEGRGVMLWGFASPGIWQLAIVARKIHSQVCQGIEQDAVRIIVTQLKASRCWVKLLLHDPKCWSKSYLASTKWNRNPQLNPTEFAVKLCNNFTRNVSQTFSSEGCTGVIRKRLLFVLVCGYCGVKRFNYFINPAGLHDLSISNLKVLWVFSVRIHKKIKIVSMYVLSKAVKVMNLVVRFSTPSVISSH